MLDYNPLVYVAVCGIIIVAYHVGVLSHFIATMWFLTGIICVIGSSLEWIQARSAREKHKQTLAKAIYNLDLNHLWIAADEGDVSQLVRILHSHKNLLDNPSFPARKHITLMHVAARKGQTNVIFALARLGSQAMYMKNSKGNLPIHYAAKSGNYRAVEVLSDLNGTAIDAKNNKGRTPMYCAAKHGCNETIDFLHSALGSNALDTPDNIGNTPLFAASNWRGHQTTIELIVHLGSEAVNTKNVYDQTPLREAARLFNAKNFKSLCALGATQYNITFYHDDRRDGEFDLNEDETLAIRGRVYFDLCLTKRLLREIERSTNFFNYEYVSLVRSRSKPNRLIYL